MFFVCGYVMKIVGSIKVLHECRLTVTLCLIFSLLSHQPTNRSERTIVLLLSVLILIIVAPILSDIYLRYL